MVKHYLVRESYLKTQYHKFPSQTNLCHRFSKMVTIIKAIATDSLVTVSI